MLRRTLWIFVLSAAAGCNSSDSVVQPIAPTAGTMGAPAGVSGGSTAAGSGGPVGAAGTTGFAGTAATTAGVGAAGVGAAGMGTSTAGTGTAGTGAAGTAGTGAGGAGTGAAGMATAAGTGGSGEPQPMGFCGAEIYVGSHIVLDVTWPGTLALEQGAGKIHIWLSGKHTKGADGNYTFEERTCGTVIPDVVTTAIAGSVKVSPQIPDATWDIPSMPKFPGTSTITGNMRAIKPAPALVGVNLADANGAWPNSMAIRSMQVDQDGDGKIGITNVPKEGGDYAAPPTSLLQVEHADRLYIASRPVLTLSATVEGCPDSYSGTATVTKFDIAVIGCRVKETQADCTTEEAQFVYDNQPVFALGNATFQSKIVPATATCADVRAALP